MGNTDKSVSRRARVDLSRPSSAEIYDFFLGGKDNGPAAREAGASLVAAAREVPPAARRNRAVLGRVVRYAVADLGVRQILDIGSGYPRTRSEDVELRQLHDQAGLVGRDVRCVYVDRDPVVVSHGRAAVDAAADPNIAMVEADMLDPGLMQLPGIRDHLDLGERVVLVLGAVLHFVDDDTDAAELVRRLYGQLAPGSLVAISHATGDELRPDRIAAAQSVYTETDVRLTFRSRTQVEALFDGLRLLEPGVVYLDQWKPEHSPAQVELSPKQERENRLGSTWLQVGVGEVPRAHDPGEASSGVVEDRPHIAKVYRAFTDKNAALTRAEQRVVETVQRVAPEAALIAREAKEFTRRALREEGPGVTQWLDLGCGYLSGDADDVHRVVREEEPQARVVYVDMDEDAVAQGRELLDGDPLTAIIQADGSRPVDVLNHPDVRRLIDFSQPVGLLTCLYWHCVPDYARPHELMRQYRDALALGSVLILSHITEGEYPGPARKAANAYYRYHSNTAMVLRSAPDIRRFFDGWTLLEPGLATPANWRSNRGGIDASRAFLAITAPDWVLVGVGRLEQPQLEERATLALSVAPAVVVDRHHRY